MKFPEQLRQMGQAIEQYLGLIQTASQNAADPKMREQLSSLHTLIRDTHSRFQAGISAFDRDAKAKLQAAQAQLEEAQKKIAAAAAARQQALEQAAARRVAVKEIDSLLNEKLQSKLLEDFGNRDRLPPATPVPRHQKGREVWQDWPTT